MKQVIFLGFHCQIYKKAPVARIYVGDVMIDEIEIPEFYTEEYMKDGQLTITNKNKSLNVYELKKYNWSPNELHIGTQNNNHVLQPPWYIKKFSYLTFKDTCNKADPLGETNKIIKHPKIFVYVIDDEILKQSQGTIKIEIKNTDSNYSNGFMTQSTLLYLSVFYMIPYMLFKDPINYGQRYLDLFSRESTTYNVKKMILFYKTRLQWPKNFNDYFTVYQNNIKKKAVENVVGGNAKFQIEMKKKYGIYWPKDVYTSGFFWLNRFFIKDFVVPLNNKYKQNENQRNTD